MFCFHVNTSTHSESFFLKLLCLSLFGYFSYFETIDDCYLLCKYWTSFQNRLTSTFRKSPVFLYFIFLQSSYQQQHHHPPASTSTLRQSRWSSSPLVSGGPPRPWRLWVLLGDGQCASGQRRPQDPPDGGKLGSSRHRQLALLPWSYCQGTPVNQCTLKDFVSQSFA